MEEALSVLEVTNLTRGTMRMLNIKQVNKAQVLLLKFFDWDAATYAQWISELREMTQTLTGYKFLWDTWKKAAIREYKLLDIIEDIMENPGGGAPYIAGAKRAFATMYGDVPWGIDAAAEPARMNWSKAMLRIANQRRQFE